MDLQSKIRGFSELIDLNVSLWAEMDLQLKIPGKQNLLKVECQVMGRNRFATQNPEKTKVRISLYSVRSMAL